MPAKDHFYDFPPPLSAKSQARHFHYDYPQRQGSQKRVRQTSPPATLNPKDYVNIPPPQNTFFPVMLEEQDTWDKEAAPGSKIYGKHDL